MYIVAGPWVGVSHNTIEQTPTVRTSMGTYTVQIGDVHGATISASPLCQKNIDAEVPVEC